jgi:hypothetical protein
MHHDQGCLPLPLSAIYAHWSAFWSAAKSHQRHTCGYIIVIDLLGLCLGPRVVDGLVEGALRPFGVPRLVSLRKRRTTDMANHCLVGYVRSQTEPLSLGTASHTLSLGP